MSPIKLPDASSGEGSLSRLGRIEAVPLDVLEHSELVVVVGSESESGGVIVRVRARSRE